MPHSFSRADAKSGRSRGPDLLVASLGVARSRGTSRFAMAFLEIATVRNGKSECPFYFSQSEAGKEGSNRKTQRIMSRVGSHARRYRA